ncbi:hypothetical protein M2323_004447 [Rhodoblastus acidophilus]|uniref:helix-turn-helix domain-containing protein n=1 Tax=Rhodoblastus acidophilus TaxID=1074 RepID=UPI0022246D2B|nr:helix-turn-helix domain-containing protein [Rhodoblastus acidophilus]MCW2286678.1 hypothetical protein [Rhodoblastus acidophilus]MCW2335498.1 hypothetical protein [Rhodoblastus acidophilus]
MAAAIKLRSYFSATGLKAAASGSRNGAQARRLLALAAIYDGASRSEAACIGSVSLQVVRDWVLRFNASGLSGLIDGKAAPSQERAPHRACARHRGGSNPGNPLRRALAHRRSLPMAV